jgi:hypothetical protein
LLLGKHSKNILNALKEYRLINKANPKKLISCDSESLKVKMNNKSLKEMMLKKRKSKLFNKIRFKRLKLEEQAVKNLQLFDEKDYQKLKTISEKLI